MLEQYLPNLIKYIPDFIEALGETARMLLVAGTLSILIGLIIGVLIIISKPEGIMPNAFINKFFDTITNLVWSIPFFILYMTMMPLVTTLMGQNALRVQGSYLPLMVGTIPFFVRQVENALSEVNPGLIEAAQSMGSSNIEIITRVYLKEAIPSLVRGASITLVVLFGLTTIAGNFGPGGLGIFVKRYGYDRNMKDILYVSLVVIIIIVAIIQGIGSYIAKKTTH